MNKLRRLILLYILVPMLVQGFEGSETFNVKLFDKRVKVLAPSKVFKELTLIIENKTLVKQIGKVEYDDETLVDFVTVEPNSSESVRVVNVDQKRLFYVPLSPSFQKVELKIGKPSYEIPPKE